MSDLADAAERGANEAQPAGAHRPSHPGGGAEHAHHLKYGFVHVGQAGDVEDLDDDTPTDDPGLQRARQQRARELRDLRLRDKHADRRFLFRRPRALQYFRRGTLIRGHEERSSGRTELFFDLIFVGLVAVLSKQVTEEPTGASLVRYILTYLPAYIIWGYMREIFNNYYLDDVYQRLLVLFVMCGLVVYGNNAGEVQEQLTEGYGRATTVGTYLVLAFVLHGTMLVYTVFAWQFAPTVRAHSLPWLPTMGLYIGSIFAPVRVAIALVAIAIAWEFGAFYYAYSGFFKRHWKLVYSTATAVDHTAERYMDFVTLVHGEFLYGIIAEHPGILVGGKERPGMHGSTARAILLVIVAFGLFMAYVNGTGSRRIVHPLRRSTLAAMGFFTFHTPLVCAVTLCGDVAVELVKENVIEEEGHPDRATAYRWLFAGTYAVAIYSMTAVQLCEQDNDPPGSLWVTPRILRLLPRLAGGLIVALLPLASQEQLGSTGLLAIPAAISMAAGVWELVTALDGPKSEVYTEQNHKWAGHPKVLEPFW